MNDGGLIKYFNLEEWFNNLSETEKEKVREYYFCDLGIGFTISTNQNNNLSINSGHPDRDESILEVGDPEKYLNSIHPRLTQEKFLQKIGSTAIHFKDYEFAEKAISKALEIQYIDPVTRHFNYNILIDLYYKLRNKKDDALDKCIQYCKEDLKYLDDFLNSYKKEEESLNSDSPSDIYQGVSFPRIPSIERLSIIYEKQGNIEDAIKICDIALKYELKDSTKGGFQRRMERLEKKLTEPRLNVYQKPKTGKVQIKKKKNIRPIIPYN
jgi:tetratricopeptide (TPR) repeat protein